MFMSIDDFASAWKYESDSTAKVLRALTDKSLAQQVSPGHRTLGRIAWHLTTTIPEMLGQAGLSFTSLRHEADLPTRAADIVSAYEKVSHEALQLITTNWDNKALQSEDNMYGENWKKGFTLTCLISHQAHHRGQMTILMRQAGLAVPGIYGPSLEEWASMGAPAPVI